MDTMTAMRTVYDHLRDNRLIEAQNAVVDIEREGCFLPSSMFERVLTRAMEADVLQPWYAEFCRRAYGPTAYDMLVTHVMRRMARS